MAVPYTSLEKAAALLVCLGVEKAAQVLGHLSYDEVQMLASQMAHTRRIPRETKLELIGELRERYKTAEMESSVGGINFVERLLSQTFGEERAAMVMEQLTQRKGRRPFSSLRAAEAHRILDIIATEHPSVIALVMYYLPRDKAAQVLAGLPVDVRHEVVMRLVSLQQPMPHVVARLEQLLSQKLSDARSDDEEGERDFGAVTGARTLVEILGRADPNVEERVYEFLQERDPALAEEVRKSMFVFADIANLDTRALQLVLRELSSQELALALKSAGDDLRELVFGNVSENFAKTLREELELLGPVRVSQIEQAQQKVVATVRSLAEQGVITIVREEEELVE
jgi:flagellar motor switch protein FliG